METIKNKMKDSIFLQILSSIVLSIILFSAASMLNDGFFINKNTILLGVVITLATAFAALFMKQVKWELVFLYLFIATSFLGAGILSINLGPFSLFPYRLFFLLSLGLFAIGLLRGKVGIYESKVKYIISFLYIWLGYGFLSLLWAESVTEGIKYLMLLFIGIMLVTLVNVYLTQRLQYLNLFYIWIMMTVVLIFIGLWNHFTKQHLPISTINTLPEHVQHIPTTVFVNQNDYATFLAISCFFFISFMKYSQNQLIKLANLSFLALSLYLIYVTSSRASMLGLGIGLGIYVFWQFGPALKKFILIAGSVAFSLALILSSGRFFGLLDKLNFQNMDPSNMGSNEIRVNLIRNAFHFITETYGFGVGAGNSQVYLEHYAKYFTRNIYKLHNWWLEIFANFGMLIFAGYVLMFVILIVSFYKFLKRSTDCTEKMIAEALLFSLITFIPASISPSSVSNLFFHWVLLAFSIGFLNYIKRKPSYHSRVY